MYDRVAHYPIGINQYLYIPYSKLTDEEKQANLNIAYRRSNKDFSHATYNGIYVVKMHHCEKNIEPSRIYKDNLNFFYECICPYCKNRFVAEIEDVVHGHKLSCGCKYIDHSDEQKYPRFKFLFHDMMAWCYTPSSTGYKYFGEKGITVCPEWYNNFSKFKEDMFEDYKKHIDSYGPDNTTFTRIDSSKPFSKDNCIICTKEESRLNNGTSRLITYRDNKYTMSSILELFADSSFSSSKEDKTRFRDKMRKSQYFDNTTYTINNPSIFVDIKTRSSMNFKSPIHMISREKAEEYSKIELPKFN